MFPAWAGMNLWMAAGVDLFHRVPRVGGDEP
ncbi:conserved hypothetical protein (fragment) [Ralstonia solanacearum K60]